MLTSEMKNNTTLMTELVEDESSSVSSENYYWIM